MAACAHGWRRTRRLGHRSGRFGVYAVSSYNHGMSNLKDIPVVDETARVRSGEKYLTPQGFTAIRDGIKAHGSVAEARLTGKPPWLRVRAPVGTGFQGVQSIVREHRLATVCEEAKCPNIGECWSAGTATIMLMGAVCTRACRFCSVDTGNPHGWLDAEEPQNAARTVGEIEGAPVQDVFAPGRAPVENYSLGFSKYCVSIGSATAHWVPDWLGGGQIGLANVSLHRRHDVVRLQQRRATNRR